jgi:NifU-like protein involved in Fe-S cluster formation
VSGQLYNDLVRDLFAGVQPDSSHGPCQGDWLTGEAGSVEGGTWVRLKLRIQDARVTNARFSVYGCPHTVAATAWVVRQIIGRNAGALLPEGIAKLCEPLEVPVEKLGRLLVIEDAVRVCESSTIDV